MLILGKLLEPDTPDHKALVSRIGKETVAIIAKCHSAELPPMRQSLSLKMIHGGTEALYCHGRGRLVVNSEGFVVLNENDIAHNRITSDTSTPATVIKIYFDSYLAADVLRAFRYDFDLDSGAPVSEEHIPVLAGGYYHHDDQSRHLFKLVKNKLLRSNTVEDNEFIELQNRVLELILFRERGNYKDEFQFGRVRRSVRYELSRRIKRSIDYIESNYANRLSLTDMASIACLSRYYFIKAFKAYAGLTPHQFLLHRRLAHAADLLGQTDMPVRLVAEAVGFADRSSLFRNFQTQFGLTPTGYRRNTSSRRH